MMALSVIGAARSRLLTMDLRHDHGALIHVVRACDNADAPNLIAIGGENSVSVLLIVCAAVFFVS
jgi:hypothetical protein